MIPVFCVDANIFLTAWYQSYPPRIFFSLWENIVEHRDRIVIIRPVFDEIEPISPADRKLQIDQKREKYPLRIWMEDVEFLTPDVTDEVSLLSLKLEREYQVSDISKGAGQVDVTLIAYAKNHGATVVTFESMQNQSPGKKSNYKIPLICREQGGELH